MGKQDFVATGEKDFSPKIFSRGSVELPKRWAGDAREFLRCASWEGGRSEGRQRKKASVL